MMEVLNHISSKNITLNNLGVSIMLKIFEQFSIEELKILSCVCKMWCSLANSDYIWKRLCEKNLPFDKKKKVISWKKYYYQKVYTFNSNLCPSTIHLEDNGAIAISGTSMRNWGTVKIDIPKVENDVHYCEFKIINLLGDYLSTTYKCIIGIISNEFDMWEGSYIGSMADKFSFGLMANGKKISTEHIDPKKYSDGFKEGDHIGVLVDRKKDQITFFKNGKSLGVAFDKFSRRCDEYTKFYFAVSLQRSGMQVSVVRNAKTPNIYDMYQPEQKKIKFEFPFEDIPYDLKIYILSHLNIVELSKCRQISKDFKRMIDSNPMWRHKALECIPDAHDIMETESPRLSWYNIYTSSIFKFSHQCITKGMIITNNGRSVTSGSDINYWAAARLDYPAMKSGIHYCEFRIDTYRHGSIGNTWKIVCGVVSDKFDYSLTKWVGVDEKSFGYIAKSGRKVGPDCRNKGLDYGESYQEHDRVGVLVNFEEDTIEFFKNGISMGVAFEGFKKNIPEDSNLHFAVSLARWGMKVTALPTSCIIKP